MLRARGLVNALGIKHPNCREELWVDRKKNHQELGPSRMLASLLSSVERLESAMAEAKTVERSNIDRSIRVGGVPLFGVSMEGGVVVSEVARRRYAEDDVKDVVAWAEAAR